MAFLIMFLISALETSAFKKFIIPLFTVFFIFLALVPLIGIEVKGAKNENDALEVSNAVVSSSLVKTAIFGKDPNWGRIMMAIGNANAEILRDKIKIYVNGIQIAEEGKSISFHYQSVLSALNKFQIDIVIDLGIGNGRGMAWGSDLTEEYVIFNSAYTT